MVLMLILLTKRALSLDLIANKTRQQRELKSCYLRQHHCSERVSTLLMWERVTIFVEAQF